jgi:hypothetical protein
MTMHNSKEAVMSSQTSAAPPPTRSAPLSDIGDASQRTGAMRRDTIRRGHLLVWVVAPTRR